MRRYEVRRPWAGPFDHYVVYDRWQKRELCLTLLAKTEPADFLTQLDLRTSLRHPNLLPILDLAWRGRSLGVVTPLVSPLNLKKKGIAERLKLGSGLVSALRAFHWQGCLAGTVAPWHLLSNRPGSLMASFLLPSGAKVRGENSRAENYTAPEFLESGMPTQAADLYGLGMTLYWMLTGREAFQEGNDQIVRTKQVIGVPIRPRQIDPEIPGPIESLVLDLLEKQPRLRPSLERVMQVFSDVTGEEPARPRFCPPMVGRSSLISAFRDSLRAVCQSSSNGAFVIRGRSGIGKSTLLERIVRVAQFERIQPIWLSHAASDRPLECLRRLAPRLASDEIDCLCRQLQSGTSPLVVACDDAQWIDEASADLLRRLILRRAGPTLLVTTVRSDLPPKQWGALETQLTMAGRLQSHSLGPLSASSLRKLCLQAAPLGEPPCPEDLARVTGGVPFYACEFLKSGIRSQEPIRQVVPSHPPNPGIVPRRVVVNVLERFRNLDRPGREIVEMLAVLDQPVRQSSLIRLLENSTASQLLSDDFLESDLVAGLNGDLDAEIQLSHSWIGWIVREHLPESKVRKIQHRILTFLESDESPNFESIARLCARLGEEEKGLPALIRAMSEHAGNHFHRAAADLLKEYSCPVMVSHADWAFIRQSIISLRNAGEYVFAIKLAREYLKTANLEAKKRNWLLLRIAGMENLLPDYTVPTSALKDLFFGSSGTNLTKPDLISASSHLLVKLTFGKSEMDRLKASQLFHFLESIHSNGNVTSASKFPPRQLLIALGLYLHCTCQFHGSLKYVAENFRRAQTPLACATGYLTAVMDLVELDYSQEQVSKFIKEGRFLAADLGNAELFALSLGLEASHLRRTGCHSEAARVASAIPSRGLKTYQNDFRREVTAANQCWALHPETALELVSHEPKNFVSWFDYRRIRNWSLFYLGRVDEALADARNRQEPEPWKDDILAARCYMAKGAFQEAADVADRAEGIIPLALPSYRTQILLLQSAIAIRMENLEVGRDAALHALSISQEHFLTPWMAMSYAQSGLIEARLKNLRLARSLVLRAEQVAKRTDRPEVHILVNRVLGEIEARMGRFSASRYRYGQALRILKEKLLHISTQYREGFRALHIEPIEIERRHWIKSTIGDRNLLHTLSSFVSGLDASDTPKSLAEKTVLAIIEALPHLAVQFWFRGIRDPRAKKIASCGTCSNSGLRFFRNEDHCPQIEIGTGNGVDNMDPAAVYLRVYTGPQAEALIYLESQTGQISEIELDFLTCVASVAEKRLPKLVREPSHLEPGTGIDLASGKLVGRHPRMQLLFQQINQVAQTNCTVLILGESGTGKELIAQALHAASPRGNGPFVALNCGSIPDTLIESELFGYRKGSFTGADRDRQGLFEAAHEGTLFLDEIASMPVALQTRLLRALQERKIRRIGESRERPIDVRILAASNQDLADLVRQGSFRPDLYFRLKVIELLVPPLRLRMGDIPLLAEYFLDRLNEEYRSTKAFSPEALGLLARYPFPGNVRELQNLVESAFHLSTGEVLDLRNVKLSENPEGILGSTPGMSRAQRLYRQLTDGKRSFWTDVREPFLNRDLCREDLREIVHLALAAAGGNYRQVVRLLGLPDQDYRKLLNFLTHYDCKLDFRPYRERAFG